MSKAIKSITVFVILAIVFLLLIWFTAIITDTAFYFTSQVRILILIFISTLTLFIFFKTIFAPILSYIQFQYSKDFTSITNEIGDNFPEIADKLTNIYQLIIGKIEREFDPSK